VSSSAGFSLYIPAGGHVEVTAYDLTGRSVAVLQSGEMAGGGHSFRWNLPSGIVNGVYLLRATTPTGTATTRMTVVR
jgi:uncharacterized protein YfaS (alpha-2-macroglobulin family)